MGKRRVSHLYKTRVFIHVSSSQAPQLALWTFCAKALCNLISAQKKPSLVVVPSQPAEVY